MLKVPISRVHKGREDSPAIQAPQVRREALGGLEREVLRDPKERGESEGSQENQAGMAQG